MEKIIRPSSDLRNYYSEISRGDTAVLGLQDDYQIKSELELLRTLAEVEEDALTSCLVTWRSLKGQLTS